MTVWVDADASPVLLRKFLITQAESGNFTVSFVANKEIEKPQKNVLMKICQKEKEAADNFIVENAKRNDIVITRDIPFAKRLVEKKIAVMNERGIVFSKDNIAEKLLERNLNMNLAEIGFGRNKKSAYSEKELKKFCSSFEYELNRHISL